MTLFNYLYSHYFTFFFVPTTTTLLRVKIQKKSKIGITVKILKMFLKIVCISPFMTQVVVLIVVERFPALELRL
jgi:hypothetical protein